MSNYIISIIILFIILLGIIKKVNVFIAFKDGVDNTLKVIVNLFIFLFTFNFAVTLFKSSGIIEGIVSNIISNINPQVLLELIIRPISSSSSLAITIDLYNLTGINSFESLFCTFLHSGMDAFFYVCGLYQSLLCIENSNIIKHSFVLYIICIMSSIAMCLILKLFL